MDLWLSQAPRPEGRRRWRTLDLDRRCFPQGTVLGPLLFLVYINDLPNNINSSVRLFADDCVLYRQIQNQFDLEALQQDLNTLCKWEKDWQMHFNPQKCYVMRLTHKRNPVHYDYLLGNSILQETDNHPYLGVTITNNLTWNKHIDQITASVNRSLRFIRRNLHSCPQATKESAYKTLVRPVVEYSSSVWDPYTQSLTHKIEMVQGRAARVVTGDYQTKSKGCMSDMLNKLDGNLFSQEGQPDVLSSSTRASTVTFPYLSETSFSRPHVRHGTATPNLSSL